MFRLFGGTIVTFVIFIGLSWHSLSVEVPKKTHEENLTEQVIRGKVIWEEKDKKNKEEEDEGPQATKVSQKDDVIKENKIV